MRILTYISLITLIAFSSCQKQDAEFPDFNLSDGELTLTYKETQCADPWNDSEQFDPNLEDTDKVDRLLYFFDSQGIEVKAVQYQFNEDDIIACLECNCSTGGVYYVKISNNEETLQKLILIGFRLI